MKYLHLKLSIAILVVFGLLITGFALYEPAWWRWQAWKLSSDDKTTRDLGARAVAAKGTRAMPHIRNWLKSKKDKLLIGTCLVLKEIEYDIWEEVYPEIRSILMGRTSAGTDAVAALFQVDFPGPSMNCGFEPDTPGNGGQGLFDDDEDEDEEMYPEILSEWMKNPVISRNVYHGWAARHR